MKRKPILLLPMTLMVVAACSREPATAPVSTLASPSSANEANSTPEKILDHVDAEAAAALLGSTADDSPGVSVTVLDVRTPAEFAAGHIQGAINVDFHSEDFKAELDKLDKTKAYLVHCRSGYRSKAALKTLQELGFNSIYHLDGGIDAWNEAGKSLEK